MNEKTEPSGSGRLAKAESGGQIDRAMRQDLERMRAGDALARQEATSALARALAEASRPPLDVAEISSVLDRVESNALTELQELLDATAVAKLDVGQNLLAELLREGVEGQAILKRGLAFLKHRRYAEAAEWWSLNQRCLDSKGGRLELLLLIMESLTYLWAGNSTRSEAIAEKVRAHKLYPRG